MPEATLRRLETAPTVTEGDPVAPILETRNLCWTANGRRLVDNVDLTIRPGRRTLIMGANGAGKSLLLRLLHGLLRPADGEILWKGGPLDRSARKAQAMVFQRAVLLRRSVAANLDFALAVRGLKGSAKAARVREALAQARLETQARQPARLLSGGEQQRLALVRALSCDPDLLFLDEPTASLDPASTHAIEDLVLAAHARGVTIVMVTHDLGQAKRLADDIVFLHAGRVAETGPASRVLETPRSEAARAWLEGRLFLGTETTEPIRHEGES
uniref:ATP-binding cassette domain-containing protein n=1 Tax=Stappia sp. TaxID=1870903 RepID=UPI003BAAC085